MRPLAILLLLCCLMLESCLLGQTNATKKIARAEAIRIASRLIVGMRQADASKMLVQGGFQEVSAALCSHDTFLQNYPLTDGCDLCLEYMPTLSSSNSPVLRLRNSLLQHASITSNGVDIITITLTNAP